MNSLESRSFKHLETVLGLVSSGTQEVNMKQTAHVIRELINWSVSETLPLGLSSSWHKSGWFHKTPSPDAKRDHGR